jgi:hypothetical protein
LAGHVGEEQAVGETWRGNGQGRLKVLVGPVAVE